MFYNNLFKGIDSVVNAAISTNVVAVINFLAPILNSMMIIYVAWLGMQMIMGKVESPLKESIFHILKIVTVYSFAINAGLLNDMIVEVLTKGPEDVARIFANTDTSSLDAVLKKGFEVGDIAWNKAGMLDFGLIFVAIFIYGATLMVTAYSAFLIILSKLFIAVLVAIAPIFISLALFDSTKRFFEAWLGQALNFFLTIVLVFAVLSLFMSGYQSFVNNLAADANMMGVGQLVIFSVIFVLILMQIPAVAAALGGGTQLSTQGAFGAALGMASGAAKAMRPTALRKSYMGAKRDVNIVKQAGKGVANAFRKRFS